MPPKKSNNFAYYSNIFLVLSLFYQALRHKSKFRVPSYIYLPKRMALKGRKFLPFRDRGLTRVFNSSRAEIAHR